jgi:hypothetical protein
MDAGGSVAAVPGSGTVAPFIELPEPHTIVTGSLLIRVSVGTLPNVRQVRFAYRQSPTSAVHTIGVATSGADRSLNCRAVPGRTGDGWSARWDTRDLPEGTYTLSAVIRTDHGTTLAKTSVYVTQTPPAPAIRYPAFGQAVAGPVEILATGGPGVRADFTEKFQAQIVTFPVDPTNQHNYGFDHVDGDFMCDPSSEAAVMWKYRDIREAFHKQIDLKHLCDQDPDHYACIKRKFIEYIATKKKTNNKNGTDYGNAQAATKALLQDLGLTGWDFTQGNTKRAAIFNVVKSFSIKAKTKGVLLYLSKGCDAQRIGHVVALISLKDDEDADKTHEMHFMDPDTGSDVTVHMDADGNFKFPSSLDKWCVVDMGAFTGPEGAEVVLRDPSSKLAGNVLGLQRVAFQANEGSEGAADWRPIATVATRGRDGWSTVWDTRSARPGFHWIRVTVTNAAGYAQSDEVEVLLQQ